MAPNSVVHYTSLEVLLILLNKAIESGSDAITLHLSQLSMMNDAGEGAYVLDRYYTDSDFKRELKQKWDSEFYPAHVPFVLSLAATDRSTCTDGSLPMWRAYGADCKGVFIRFNYRKLKQYCDDNGFTLAPCKYLTTKEVGEMIKGFNKNDTDFEEIMRESCLTKRCCWNYEKEWRIVLNTSRKNIKVKNTSRGLVEYVELPLPLNLIEEICIGPLCEKENTLKCLGILKDTLSQVYPDTANFKISESRIPLK